jgi:uncharacterized RDD family membrane protein YckC
MSTPEAGWYDDPWSPDQYRYWDGSMWTPHAAPKHGVSQAAPSAVSVGSNGASTMATGPSAPPPYTGYATQPEPWRPTFGPTTPDGVPLASRWARLGGRLLDNLFVAIVALPLNLYFLVQYNQAASTWSDELSRRVDNGETPNPFAFSGDMIKWLIPIMIVNVVVGLVYEIFFLRRSGATPGKHVVGTAVRRYDDPQIPPDMTAIGRRSAVIYGLQTLYVVPLLFIPALLLWAIDSAWLLWDSKRQTWHDKAAATTVVKNR